MIDLHKYPHIENALQEGWVMEVAWTPDRDFYVCFQRPDGSHTGFYSMADLDEISLPLGEWETDFENEGRCPSRR